jgi:hypothetical protein
MLLVLLVATDARSVLARILEEVGCSVHEAADGREAVAAIEYAFFEAMVLDLSMPQMDGCGCGTPRGDGAHHQPQKDSFPIPTSAGHCGTGVYAGDVSAKRQKGFSLTIGCKRT